MIDRVARAWHDHERKEGCPYSLLPPGKPHPLGCHNPRVDDRKAMDAIFFVLRTGCQWGALDATGICNHSSAHRRFQEWTAAGVFVTLWATGLQEYDALVGLDWSWLAMDGAMTKAPLGGEWVGKNPTDRGKPGSKRHVVIDANGIPLAVTLSAANVHDSRMLEATVDAIPAIRQCAGRPRRRHGDPHLLRSSRGHDAGGAGERAARRSDGEALSRGPEGAGHRAVAAGAGAAPHADDTTATAR